MAGTGRGDYYDTSSEGETDTSDQGNIHIYPFLSVCISARFDKNNSGKVLLIMIFVTI